MSNNNDWGDKPRLPKWYKALVYFAFGVWALVVAGIIFLWATTKEDSYRPTSSAPVSHLDLANGGH